VFGKVVGLLYVVVLPGLGKCDHAVSVAVQQRSDDSKSRDVAVVVGW